MDDPFIEYIERRRELVARTIAQLESLCLDFKVELSDLSAAMKVRLRMNKRTSPAAPAGDVASTVKSITEMPEKPSEPTTPAPKQSPPSPSGGEAVPGRGPKPTKPRPPGIPTNLEMCIKALETTGRPMSGSEIENFVQAKWWSDIPRDWKSTPFGFISSGKLVKNRGNLFELPTPPKAEPPAPQPVVKAAPPPKAAPIASPAPRPPSDRMFKHKNQAVDLPDKAWRVVTRLYAAMGQGMIEFKPLADHAFKGDAGTAISPQLWLEDLAEKVNPMLAEIKLAMVCVSMMPRGPKAGYVLRELP